MDGSESGWKALQKQRMDSDPEYREKAKKWRRDFRAKRRVSQRPEERKPKRQAGPAAAWKTIDVLIDGVVTPMYTLGVLAKIFGKGLSTLRVWEAKGVLPTTPYRTARGDRLYPYDMVIDIRAQLVAQGRVPEVAPKRQVNKLRTSERYVRFDNGEVRKVALYRVLTLGEVLGRTSSQIWAMEADGMLPATPLRASKMEHRMYTPGMIQATRAVLERFGFPLLPRRFKASLIRNAILDEWEKLGLRNAEVVDEGTDCNGRGGTGSPVGQGIRRNGAVDRAPAYVANDAADDGNGVEALQSGRPAG